MDNPNANANANGNGNGNANTHRASSVLPSHILAENVPGSIRKAEHFIVFMKKLVEHLKTRLGVLKTNSNTSLNNNNNNNNNNTTPATVIAKCETPLRFLTTLTASTGLQSKPLSFAYDRLASLLRTIEISNLQEFNGERAKRASLLEASILAMKCAK